MPTVLDFQRLRDTVLPEWTKPENASVFDPAYRAPIRKIISLLGLDDPQQVMALGTPLETGSMAGGAVEAISKRFPRFAQALKLYHGSPHDFERFDASKIGTGEGAQAYGHGLYFAENPNVAASYKNILGGREFDVKGRKLYSSSGMSSKVLDQQSKAETVAADFLDDAFNAQSTSPAQFADIRMRQHMRYYPEDSKIIEEARNIIADWQESGGVQRLQGKTYEVAVHADPEHFLDWDKPLSQQSEHVRNAVKEAIGPLAPLRNRDGTFGIARLQKDGTGTAVQGISAPTFESAKDQFYKEWLSSHGQEIYHSLGARETPQAAAEKLKKAGVNGIKYFDQGSRATGEGSRNYVVFPGNEHLIDILKKYGIAATTGVGIAGGLNANE